MNTVFELESPVVSIGAFLTIHIIVGVPSHKYVLRRSGRYAGTFLHLTAALAAAGELQC